VGPSWTFRPTCDLLGTFRIPGTMESCLSGSGTPTVVGLLGSDKLAKLKLCDGPVWALGMIIPQQDP
jgi:hypothetical protein